MAERLPARDGRNLAATEGRMAAARERDDPEADVAAVGRELGLHPEANYHDRCRVFSELARRGHAIGRERYGRPA